MRCLTELVGTGVVWLVVVATVFAVSVVVVVGTFVGSARVRGMFTGDFAVIRELLYKLLDVIFAKVAVPLDVVPCLGLVSVGADVVFSGLCGVGDEGGACHLTKDLGTCTWIGIVGLGPPHVDYKRLYIML